MAAYDSQYLSTNSSLPQAPARQGSPYLPHAHWDDEMLTQKNLNFLLDISQV